MTSNNSPERINVSKAASPPLLGNPDLLESGSESHSISDAEVTSTAQESLANTASSSLTEVRVRRKFQEHSQLASAVLGDHDVDGSNNHSSRYIPHSYSQGIKTPQRHLVTDAMSFPLPETPARDDDESSAHEMLATGSVMTPVRKGNDKEYADGDDYSDLPVFASPQQLTPQLSRLKHSAPVPPKTDLDEPSPSAPNDGDLPTSPPRVNSVARNNIQGIVVDLEKQPADTPEKPRKYSLSWLSSFVKKYSGNGSQPSIEKEESTIKFGSDKDDDSATVPDVSPNSTPKSTFSFDFRKREDKFENEDGTRNFEKTGLNKSCKVEVLQILIIGAFLIIAISVLSYGLPKIQEANAIAAASSENDWTLEPTESFTTSPTTLHPTSVPTSPIPATRLPSVSPANYPTISPSASPTRQPSKVPTNRPTSTPTVLTREQRFSSLMQATDASVYSKTMTDGTKHREVYEWMMKDPDFFSYSDKKLIQRFVLALFSLQVTLPSAGRRLNRNALETWMQYTDECMWFTSWWQNRLGCNRAGDFRRLVLINLGLEGTLPSELALLPNLDTLMLPQNNFQGTIPQEYSQLTTLVTFNMTMNKLQGTLPAVLYTIPTLDNLDVGDNQLVAPISQAFCWRQLTVFRTDCWSVQCPCCTSCADSV